MASPGLAHTKNGLLLVTFQNFIGIFKKKNHHYTFGTMCCAIERFSASNCTKIVKLHHPKTRKAVGHNLRDSWNNSLYYYPCYGIAFTCITSRVVWPLFRCSFTRRTSISKNTQVFHFSVQQFSSNYDR